MGYIISLIVLIVVYIGVVFAMKYMTNYKLTNLIFVSLIVGCYIALLIKIYNNDGFNHWNFKNALPVANVSPFMFALTAIIFVFPKSVRKYLLLLISVLMIGMFASTVFNCLRNTLINYKFHPHFMLDYISHFAMSLWGIYLIKSNQVEIKFKDCFISAMIIVGVAIVMMALNIVLDTAFFGLSLNGKHNIYNNVIVNNSYLSALIYFSGLGVVLVLGIMFSALIKKSKK